MSERIHVLIADEDAALLDTLHTMLSANHHIESVSACSTGIGLSDKVRRLRPDVVLLDLILPGINGLSVLENLSTDPPRSRPTIFVMSSFVSPETAAECSRLGVSFYLRKPLDFTSLADLIVRYGVHPRAGVSSFFPNDPLLSLAITQLLTNYGFSQHMMGFRYIRDGVLYAIYNDTALDAVTKVLYPQIAKKHQTAWTSVERDIRTAIQNAWQRSGGHFPGFSKGSPPTSREFLSVLTDRLAIQRQIGSVAYGADEGLMNPHCG